MARYRTIADPELTQLLARYSNGEASTEDISQLVRHFLAVISKKSPGQALELRIPPFGAVQIGSGVQHTRGKPPAVIELNPETWIELAIGLVTWEETTTSAWDERTNISNLLPLITDSR